MFYPSMNLNIYILVVVVTMGKIKQMDAMLNDNYKFNNQMEILLRAQRFSR